ncbi:466_t:CDS:2, partial [Rhizophagus irregularis]
LHVVLGDFNDTIDNKIDRSPSTEQPGSQFLIQLAQLGLYDVCRALYPDTELFTYEKWDKNKDKSRPILRSRIDQIWITHEADIIPVEFSVHSSQMITNSHHSIISTTINILGFIKNNFRHCVPDQIWDLNVDDRHQNNRIVDISKINNLQWENFTETLDREIEVWNFQQLINEFNHEIQLGYEMNNDEEKIRCRFNELWNNIMSAISIAVNIELPMKIVKYPGSRNIKHKLSFIDKTMQYTTKLGSLMRKINKDQDFIDNKNDQWINFWLNRLNKYNKDYNRKEYDKFINNHKELTIPTHGLFSDTWIKNTEVVKKRVKIDKNYLQAQRLRKIQDSIENRCNIIHSDIPKWLYFTQDNVKEHIIIDRVVISNENEGVRLAIDPDTIRTHAKDTFAGILRKRNTKSIEQDVFWRINNPWDQICANQITSFTYLINSNSLASRSIMIRCRAAQLRLAIHDNIFEHESESLFLGHQEAKSNLSLHNIIIARKLNIVIQQDYINRTTWAISGGNIPTREIFITYKCLNLLRKIGTANSYPLYMLPVSEDKRKHTYVIIKDKNNKLSIGLVKKRTHIQKNGEKIDCLIIEVCNIKIYSDNSQKAIIQKQECPKIITIAQHNALVLPIFIQLSTGAITHIDWYYMVDSVNRDENITTNINIQQMEKTPTIELNGDNLGSWINRWIEQDTLRQELTNIRYRLRSLKNIEYYTDGSLVNRIIDTNNQLHNMAENTI